MGRTGVCGEEPWVRWLYGGLHPATVRALRSLVRTAEHGKTTEDLTSIERVSFRVRLLPVIAAVGLWGLGRVT